MPWRDLFEPRLPQAAHVVRLRATFDRKQFVSATSDRSSWPCAAELLQLFGHAGTASCRGASAEHGPMMRSTADGAGQGLPAVPQPLAGLVLPV
jgi:ribonuclease P protein component